jgi:hypothetical protein
MTTTIRPTAARDSQRPAKRFRTDAFRKTALVAGALYVLTFASSIPAKFFFIDPVLASADFFTRAGIANPLLVGGSLDLINALACIGTAVVLYPLLRRQHEGLALGFVTTRVFEAAVIVIGVISLLTVVTLHQSGTAGADTTSLTTTARALAATYQNAFLLGPILMSALNAALLGTLMYRSRLVPRAIPVMGLVGAPLTLLSFGAILFGLHDATAPTHMLAVAPIFIWELSLGFYMAIKGFRPSPLTELA